MAGGLVEGVELGDLGQRELADEDAGADDGAQAEETRVAGRGGATRRDTGGGMGGGQGQGWGRGKRVGKRRSVGGRQRGSAGAW